MPLQIRDLFNEDLDRVFSYRTGRYVVIKDAWLGCINMFISFIIIAYVIIYAIVINEGYLYKEFSDGITIVEKSGGQLVTGNKDTEKFLDYTTVMYPDLDQNGFFFATKMIITSEQTQGECAQEGKACVDDSYCNQKFSGKCVNGICSEEGWCPTESGENSEGFFVNPNQFFVWFKASIHFPELDNKIVYTNINTPEPIKYPSEGATFFSINDLLQNLDEKDQVPWGQLRETGAIIHIAITWDCMIGKPCSPYIQVKRVDRSKGSDGEYQVKGFSSYKYQYYRDSKSSPLKRIQYHSIGIKFIVDTKGVGKQFESNSLILQISLGMALLKLSGMFVDFLMLYIFPKRHLYAKEKYMQTMDFSELEERMRQEEEEKERKRREREEQAREKDDDLEEEDY